MADFPTDLTSAVDNTTDVLAKHINNLEAKVGVNDSTVKTSLDFLVKALPDGTMLNGRIVPSVASNDLTVALKGMDGNDPSATNPVYVRIDDEVRSITSALSVTKSAGTNWCNAGSSELATKEIDYFVYLGYNATDGVVLGFSRIPYGTRYDSFSATTTNEKYCAISTITTAAAGDYYVNVGRFAATLSAGAGYTWSVPTFTASNLIQRPIYETRILGQNIVCGGFSSQPGGSHNYQIMGRTMHFMVNQTADGTSNATDFTITLPMSAGYVERMPMSFARDSGSATITMGVAITAEASNTLQLNTNVNLALWKNSGGKRCISDFWYKI
jgi:hypothetical protein